MLRRSRCSSRRAPFAAAVAVAGSWAAAGLFVAGPVQAQSGGDKAAAEPFLARARRLDELYKLVIRVRSPEQENRPPDLLQFANACEEAGLVEEARHWYELAISRDPLDAKAQAGLYRLRTLQ